MKATIVVNMDGPAFGAAFEEITLELSEVLKALAYRTDKIGALIRNADHGETPRTMRLLDSTGAPCGRLTVSK